MKKTVLIIVLAAAVCVAGVCGYFIGQRSDKAPGEPVLKNDDFVLYDKLIDDYVLSDTIDKQYLMDNYAMDEETAEGFFANSAEWLAFQAYVNISNPTDENLSFYNVVYDKNGKDGIYICTVSGPTLGIAAGSSYQTCLTVLCNNSDLTTEEARALFEHADFKIAYSLTNDDNPEEVVTSLASITKD